MILLSAGQISQSDQIWRNNTQSLSTDTIQYLKKKSQVLLIEKKYQEVYQIFSYLADFYSFHSNQRMFFDYKNKAVNCLSKFTDQRTSMDSIFHLFEKYDNSNLNDTTLTAAIINNFINNFKNIQNYPVKLKYLDFLIDSAKCEISVTSRILLAKHRLTITNNLSILYEQLKSYYYLLNQELSQKDKINFEIDLGDLYNNSKEYQLSNITLQNTLCNKAVTELDKAIIFNIIGNNYLYLKKYSLSSYFYRESFLIRNQLQNNSKYLRVIYNNLANYYTLIGNIDSARTFYRTSLEISKKEFGNNSKETAFEFNNLGNHYYNLGNYDSAFIYYQSSFNIKQSIIDYKAVDIIHSLYNLGLTYSKLGDFSNAIPLLHKSIIKNFKLAKIFSLQNGLSSPNDYIISCKSLGEIYYNLFKQSRDNSFLDSAKTYYNKAIATNDSIIYSTPIESSKILINVSNYKILEDFLQCYLVEDSQGFYAIIDTLQILSLFDKCHNYVLLNKLIATDKNIPYSFKLSLNNNDKSLDQAYNAIELLEDDRSSNLNDMFELSRMLFKRIKNIESKDEEHDKKYSFENEEISFTRLQQLIDQHTILLEYTTIKDFLYCLAITSNSMFIYKIGKTLELKNLITECNKNLKQFSLDFNKLYDLSSILLLPLKKIPNSIDKIMIIKEENLLTLPFDVLLLDKPQNDQQCNTYLIKVFDISYSYSINLILKNSFNIPRNYNFDFIGFAPTDFVGDNQMLTNQLKGSNNEISNISKIFAINNFKTLSLFGSDANLENFYNFAGKTNILHIATHSSIANNSLNGGFLLNPTSDGSYNLINYYDVLNLTNSPNLVVLASCSSNLGKLIEGEGIQNIGRAFSINGTSFVISSLYRLDDEFSYKFMSTFYNKLLTTGNIKNSLCESKREFAKDKKYSYPTYWSNFNIIGK